MNNIRSIEDLPREEQIDVIIGQFSGHERIDEIALYICNINIL